MVHLMFADDLIVFSAAEKNTIQHLLNAFAKFSRSIGLEANKHKSQVVVGGCTERQILQIKTLTGFEDGELPFRYLGVPITANKLSRMECRMLVEKFTQRIKTWAIRSTSYAGRVALINSALMGIYNFWAIIFIIPQEMIKDLDKKCRDYLWGADETYKKVPYVSWKDICKPKRKGGRNQEHGSLEQSLYS